MAIVGTDPSVIAEATATDSANYTTTATAGANGKLYLIWVWNSHATAAAPVTLTHSGGLTCVQILTTLGSNHRGTLFRALKTSGVSAGTFTATGDGTTQTGWIVIVDEFDGIDTTGTDGSGAIVQSDANSGSSTTSTGTLAAFGDAVNNAAYMATGMAGVNEPVTEEAGYTELADLGHGTPNRHAETEYKVGEDTAPTCTWTNSTPWREVAVEVK